MRLALLALLALSASALEKSSHERRHKVRTPAHRVAPGTPLDYYMRRTPPATPFSPPQAEDHGRHPAAKHASRVATKHTASLLAGQTQGQGEQIATGQQGGPITGMVPSDSQSGKGSPYWDAYWASPYKYASTYVWPWAYYLALASMWYPWAMWGAWAWWPMMWSAWAWCWPTYLYLGNLGMK